MPDPLAAGTADLAKVYGESTRCLVCGAFASTLPHPEHKWVCAVCGAPRIVMPEGETLPEEAAVAIRDAANARRTTTLQRLATWGMAFPSAISLLLAIVLAPASLIAGGVLVGAGVLLAVLSLRASRRAATERKRLRGAVDRAWEAAIAALASKDKTPAEIATTLRIAESDVEAALAIDGVRVAPPVRIAEQTKARVEPESEPEAEAEPEAAAEKHK